MAEIISVQISPPIPDRRFDWTSYRKDNEEDGPYGYGSTKEESIIDLLELELENS